MATAYTPDSLRNLFQSSFNMAQWYGFLQHFFNATDANSTNKCNGIVGLR